MMQLMSLSLRRPGEDGGPWRSLAGLGLCVVDLLAGSHFCCR